MHIPLSWLKEYIKIDLSNEELAEILTLSGVEVNKITHYTPILSDKIVVGEIKTIEDHPYADKLKVVQVFDGSNTIQVICGDPSCTLGMKTAFAQIGAILHPKQGKTLKIKRTKLRGVESFGMLCTEQELGLSDYDMTIMHLPETMPVGTNLHKWFYDTIIELALTPNLGHCMSILGIARNLASRLHTKVNTFYTPLQGKEKNPIRAEIREADNCYRYSYRVICNIKVGPSPHWIRIRLENAKVRSINNVVDITNYVMLELGQPLHAFDYTKIVGQKITLQSTPTSLTFKTLDQITREIPPGILMIYDREKPLAIAGLIGGAHSAIQHHTTDILLEAAHFNPSMVRKASKLLGVRSQSSMRFERGIDYNTVTHALDYAAALIAKEGISEMIDIEANPRKPHNIALHITYVNQLLGSDFNANEIESLLQRLEIKTQPEQNIIKTSIPSYRNDLRQEVDLIEEIANLHGYNNIKRCKTPISYSTLPHSPISILENQVRKRLVGMGLQELITCDLISPKLAKLSVEKDLGTREEVHVLKPSSIDHSILRSSLLPGMLQVVKHNIHRNISTIPVFEIGHIHFKDGEHYRERSTVAILLTGQRWGPHHWSGRSEEVDFFDLKGIVENILNTFYVQNIEFIHSNLNSFHPAKQALLLSNNVRLGVLGEVHPNRTQHLDIHTKIFFAQIDLQDLLTMKGKEKQMDPLPQFPGSERDWTLSLKKEVPLEKVFHAIDTTPTTLLKKYTLLDLYENKKLGKTKKNVTLRLLYRRNDRTIKQEEVEREHNYLILEITKKIGNFIC